MPNITIEVTRNCPDINWQPIISDIHKDLVDCCQAGLASCKSQIARVDDYVIGDGVDSHVAFIRITIRLLSGRTVEQKQAFSERCNQIITERIVPEIRSHGLQGQATLELVDIDRDQYFINEV